MLKQPSQENLCRSLAKQHTSASSHPTAHRQWLAPLLPPPPLRDDGAEEDAVKGMEQVKALEAPHVVSLTGLKFAASHTSSRPSLAVDTNKPLSTGYQHTLVTPNV